MGIDTTITLQFSVAEEYIEHVGKKDTYPIVNLVNVWLEERKFEPLISVEDGYGGSRIPTVVVFGGAFRNFPNDEFAQFIIDLPWQVPENVVLMIQPDQGTTQVYRPLFVQDYHINNLRERYLPSLGNQVPRGQET